MLTEVIIEGMSPMSLVHFSIPFTAKGTFCFVCDKHVEESSVEACLVVAVIS